VGSDVVVTLSGAIETTCTPGVNSGGIPSAMSPSAFEVVNNPGSTYECAYVGVIFSSPSFGPGSYATADTSSTSSPFMLFRASSTGIVFRIPISASGASYAVAGDTMTFVSKTFASVGVTPGTYTVNYGTGSLITVQVGPATLPTE